jgi:hypothetical protein
MMMDEKSECGIFLIESSGLLSILDRAEALDREALQIVGALDLWMKDASYQCFSCSMRFKTKRAGGWIVVVPAQLQPTAIIGFCRQCVGRPDLLSRALALLETEADIVVEPDCAGNA